MSDQIIWICFEPINYPVPRILYGESNPNGDKDVYVPYVPAVAHTGGLEAKVDNAAEEMRWALPILEKYLPHPNDIGSLDDFRTVLAKLEK